MNKIILIMQWLDGKKTYLSGAGMTAGMLSTAVCFYLGLIDRDAALVMLTTFAGIFGGAGVISQRQATAKIEAAINKPVTHLDIVPIPQSVAIRTVESKSVGEKRDKS